MSRDPKSEYYDAGGIETLDVIELNSAAWNGPIVLVQDFVERTFTTENSDVITAQPCGMAIAHKQGVGVSFEGDCFGGGKCRLLPVSVKEAKEALKEPSNEG